MVLPNKRFRHAERPKGRDRYGNSFLVVIYEDFGGRFNRSTVEIRNVDGTVTTFDATLDTDPGIDLQAEDVLTVESAEIEKYTVGRAMEALDVNGVSQQRTYRLVKLATTK